MKEEDIPVYKSPITYAASNWWNKDILNWKKSIQNSESNLWKFINVFRGLPNLTSFPLHGIDAILEARYSEKKGGYVNFIDYHYLNEK